MAKFRQECQFVRHGSFYTVCMENGYVDLPSGKLASIVTYLELRTPKDIFAAPPAEFEIRRVERPELDWYRRLYRKVGEPWLWFSRLRMSDDALQAILGDPSVDVFALSYEGADLGLLEFDRRKFPDIEVAYFGVTLALIGNGAGRALLAHGLDAEWKHQPERIWLHTCTADHPGALSFYRKFGFEPYKRAVEIADDPRLTGDMPRTAGPHVPIIGF
jgi:GNAT superfamily N-acetyltransferase